MRIATTLIAIAIIPAVVGLVSMSLTLSALKAQADDGKVINLAGRQRMLTQKMTKEALKLVNSPAENRQAAAEQVSLTADIFAVTLEALRNGGRAPKTLSLADDAPFATTPHRRAPCQLS